jgi:hypothetical protein
VFLYIPYSVVGVSAFSVLLAREDDRLTNTGQNAEDPPGTPYYMYMTYDMRLCNCPCENQSLFSC